MTIWKYRLLGADAETIAMPVGAQILCVIVQHRAPFLWALVDEDQPMREDRVIRAFHTGHFIPEADVVDRRYIGTVQLDDGVAVFHFYE